jgi:hypothetical protein
VRWSGSDRTTTYVNATQLTASISASDIATAGTVNVMVFTPAPGGGLSNAVGFQINAIPSSFIFSDGFESGNFSAWYSTNGSPSVVVSPGWTNDQGSYAMKTDIAYGGQVFAQKGITAQTPFWMTFLWGTTNLDIGNQWEEVRAVLVSGNSENDYAVFETFANNADGTIGAFRIRIWANDDYTFFTSVTVRPNTWYQIKIQVVDEVSGGDGIVKAWYREGLSGNWTSIGSKTDCNWSAGFAGIDSIKVGQNGGDSSNIVPDFYYDKVEVAASDVW